MEEKSSKKSVKNLILFFVIIFITFYIIFKDQNPKEIFDIVRTADLKFIFIAIRIYGFIFCL